MTGHQENPGSGFTLQGEVAEIMDIETVCRALGVKNVRTFNPLDLKATKEAIDWAYSITDAPVVLITRWPCVLKKYTDDEKKEFDISEVGCSIASEKCIGCKKCLATGCPALRYDKATKKASIDTIQCVGCEVCAQVCPVNAIGKAGK